MEVPKLFQRKKKTVKVKTVVQRSIAFSIGLHGVLLFVAAVWVVSHIFYNRESTFSGQPPPMKAYEPRKLEFKVKVSKQQRSSSRPSMAPRMVASKLTTGLALPEIKMDPKIVKTTFQPKFKAFGGTGLGAGLGTGYGEGGFGDGVSSINFFGIRARGEKTAVLVDVSVSMVEPQKGGPQGFARVKQRVDEVIDSLAEGTLFNVIVFADAASEFDKQMVIANKDNKTRAKLFLRPFNSEGNFGLDQGNVQSSGEGLRAFGGTTRLDLALSTAFMQGADTIMIISDGLPQVKKGWNAQQMGAFQQQQAAWMQQNAAAVQAFDAAAVAAPAAPAQKVWVPPTPARAPAAAPLKEGAPIDKGSPAIPGHWQVIVPHGGGAARPAPPPIPDPGFWTLTDFIEHLRLLQDAYNAKKGQKPPVVHCIGYMIDNDGNAFLQGLAHHFKGEYRRVAKLKDVK